MKLSVCAAVLLLTCCVCLQRVDGRLPDVTPASPQLQSDVVSFLQKKSSGVARLPGLCRRLKRRRVTILCNQDRFCWRGHTQRCVQVCACPRGSRCSHFFIHSL